MDKLFGRHRNEESDEKPSDNITDSTGDGDAYGGDDYTQKTSDNSNTYDGSLGYDGDDFTKKSSDTIGGDEGSDEVGKGGDYSEKASYDTGDGGFGGGDDDDYSGKKSYDSGDGGFGGSDEYGGSEKPNYASGGGDGDGNSGRDYYSEKNSDTFGSVRKGEEDYSSEKASRGAEDTVGEYE